VKVNKVSLLSPKFGRKVAEAFSSELRTGSRKEITADKNIETFSQHRSIRKIVLRGWNRIEIEEIGFLTDHGIRDKLYQQLCWRDA